jgi:sugar phosphate permease
MTTAAATIPRDRWLRIIPPMIIIYVVAYMDRMNIGFAMAGGMSESLGVTATVSGLAAGVFFAGYLLLQIYGGKVAEYGSAKRFIFLSIIAWGGMSALTGLVQNGWQLLAVRFLLGVAEGGVWPAILVSISNWFPEEESARANAFFMSSLALAGGVSPFTGWIVGAFGWRSVFVIEGLISLLLVFIWLPLFADRPEDARWISKEEREYLVKRLLPERERLRARKQAPPRYKELLRNHELWRLTLIYFCNQAGQYGFLLWLPSILKDLTKAGMTRIGWLAAFPYIAALPGLYVFSILADRSMNRRFYTAVTECGFALFCLLSALLIGHVWLSYLFIVLTGMFSKAPAAIFWTLPRTLFPPGLSGTARGFINAVGCLGGLVGPLLVGWMSTLFSLKAGMFCLVLFLFAAGMIALSLPDVTAGSE